ncbi:MAG: hypothetical protein HN360_02645 [Rhodospirillaceae bacterium]|jgi:hypothetical protein|nr:hypothetical protein [Rhodospirillaceae bacterium]MBT4219489.1 hypothetical protein [Rhodospirillaceae bacterium]MBT7356904.1 hypothetical protein [Rhodospirillaceae bacterium]
MTKAWTNSQNIFITFVFLCSVFLMLFYDGTIKISNKADILFATNPQIEHAVQVQNQRIIFLDSVMMNLENMDDQSAKNHTIYRQKLRWAYKSLVNGILETLKNSLSENQIKYVIFTFFFFQAVTLTIGFVFMCLSFRVLSARQDEATTALIAFAFFWYYVMSSETPFIREGYFAFTELTCIAAAIYFALRRQMAAFLIVLAIAVANRETGAGMGVIYLIINWGRRRAWIPFVAGPLLLITFNFGFFAAPATYNISHFITPTVEGGAAFLTIFHLDKWPLPYVMLNLFKIFIFLLPALYIVGRAWSCDMGRRFIVLAGIYLTVFLLGAQIGDLMAASFLVPFIVAMYGAHIGNVAKA